MTPLPFLWLLAADAPHDAHAPPTGEVLLAEATAYLASGAWHEALGVAIPAISTHPELADSFAAIASIATDQVAREAAPADVGARCTVELPRTQPCSSPRFAGAVDLGLPSGVRLGAENEFGVVRGAGIHAGITATRDAYDWIGSLHAGVYFAFRLHEQFDLDVTGGATSLDGSPYGFLGAGFTARLREEPLRVSVGATVTLPDLYVSPIAHATVAW